MSTMTEIEEVPCKWTSAGLQYRFTSDQYYDGESVTITRTVMGGLLCSNCGNHKDWCKHIETCIKQNDDALLIWTPDAEPSPFLELRVPIIPSKNQWAECLGEFSEKVGAYKFYLKPQHVAGWSGSNFDDLTFIGFLNKGEGRAILRSILLDVLRSELETPGGFSAHMRCANANHSFKAQMTFEHNTQKTKVGALAEMWSILNTSNCITCSEGSVDDFDDLIPDVGAKKSSWR